jgi:membrane protein
LIFILLPDAHLPTRIGILGALFTAVLFSLGKWLIRWLLLRGDFNSIFGASTSLVLLLLFVFYSSFIFYYGAAFTRLCAEYYHRPVKPYKYAQLAEV